MKKYLTLAAILGVIAFVSVSYLAEADEHMNAAPAAAAAPAATETAPAIAPVPTMAQDNDACMMMASAPTTEGSAPSAEQKDAAFKKCMMGKGHTEEEMKKMADEKAAADKAAADAAKMGTAPAGEAPAEPAKH